MINFDDYTNEILIVGGPGSGKTNALLNLINNQPDIDKIYLYAKDPYEAKYQYLINKREEVGLDHFKDSKAFMEYSYDMQDFYKNIEDYNPGKKREILIGSIQWPPKMTDSFLQWKTKCLIFFEILLYC